MSIVDAFNTQLLKFISEFEKKIIINYPDYKQDVKIYRLGLKTLLLTNQNIAINNFNKYIYPYKRIIRNKDENYFINNQDTILSDNIDNITNDFNISDNDKQQYILESLKIKDIWETLSLNNKNIIWEYLIILIKLCKLWTKNK
tara:strand:- start:992 stop:1423 length:432 start_codon:yes stop_codon:yes gene_type:complete